MYQVCIVYFDFSKNLQCLDGSGDSAVDDLAGVGAGVRCAAPSPHRHLGPVRIRTPDLLMHFGQAAHFS